MSLKQRIQRAVWALPADDYWELVRYAEANGWREGSTIAWIATLPLKRREEADRQLSFRLAGRKGGAA